MEKDKLYMINKIFDNKKVRTVWDKESEKYYVSIIDIIIGFIFLGTYLITIMPNMCQFFQVIDFMVVIYV